MRFPSFRQAMEAHRLQFTGALLSVALIVVASATAQGTDKPAPPPTPKAFCHGKAATIVGTAGADTLAGTPGPDVIAGQGGDDNISGAGAEDTICGGDGNDSISGGAANDD